MDNHKNILSKSDKKTTAVYRKFLTIATTVLTLVTVMAMTGTSILAFADEEGGTTIANDANSFNTVVGFIVTWVQRIGGVIGFIGAIQFGMAFKNDDADGKTRGLMTLASGFIVIAICIAYTSLFQQT